MDGIERFLSSGAHLLRPHYTYSPFFCTSLCNEVGEDVHLKIKISL